MPVAKKPSFKDYYFNENDPSIEITMEELNISREEAIKIMKKLSYRADYPEKKKRKKQTA